MNKVKLENPNIICEMDPEAWFVILTFKPGQKAESFLEENGFKKNYNYINVREFFYENNYSRLFSYHHWLEDRYNLDIMSSSNMEYKGDNGCYSPGTLYSLTDITDQFRLYEKDKAFDFGCGKCGALVTFWSAGAEEIGG